MSHIVFDHETPGPDYAESLRAHYKAVRRRVWTIPAREPAPVTAAAAPPAPKRRVIDVAQESLAERIARAHRMIDWAIKSNPLPETRRVISMKDIQRACAAHYEVPVSDILSERKTACVVRPRQVGMYLAKELTPRSLPYIGREFGGRDHTTVLHAVRKIARLLADGDEKLQADVDAIRAALVATDKKQMAD
jgi:hypothetical protein